jgi:alpha-N-arabinofuranosidase
VHLSLVNIDAHNPQEVTVTLRGMKATQVQGAALTSTHVQDFNTFDKPDNVKPTTFKGARLNGDVLTLTLPPVSVVVLELN